MSARLIDGIEAGVELMASLFLAGAAAFAANALLRSTTIAATELRGVVGASAGAAFFLSLMVMRAMRPVKSSFRLPPFDVREVEFEPSPSSADHQAAFDELLLTDEDRIPVGMPQSSVEPLLLDDVLAQIGPDSRVVRLFDRKTMPTPGQLQSRIDDHLAHGRSAAGQDASQALSEALAELRRSLR